MAIAVVAHTIAGSSDNNSVVTPEINTVSANLIIAVVTTFAGGGPVPTDSEGISWNSLTRWDAGDAELQLFYKYAPPTDALHSFGVSAAGTYPAIAVLAVSGAAASPFDAQQGSAPGGTAMTVSPGVVSPAEDNELLICAYSGYGQAITAIDSGFTLLESVTYDGHHLVTGLAYKIQTSKAPVSPTWTLAGNSVSTSTLAAFKSSSAVAASSGRLVGNSLVNGVLVNGGLA